MRYFYGKVAVCAGLKEIVSEYLWLRYSSRLRYTISIFPGGSQSGRERGRGQTSEEEGRGEGVVEEDKETI